ncbi:MAG: hypothetical protein PVS3B2_00060 [Candidatus Dormibacteraceae bacterium]
MRNLTAATAAISLIAMMTRPALAQDEPLKIKLPPSRTLSSTPSSDGNGRFVFGQVSDFRADRFMLDTKTGRLWQLVVDKESNYHLELVPYDDADGRPQPRPPQ